LKELKLKINNLTTEAVKFKLRQKSNLEADNNEGLEPPPMETAFKSQAALLEAYFRGLLLLW
jgi:hypothetical protein